jgi:3',5'-cyclic AMP phosphodiesterase CpdA
LLGAVLVGGWALPGWGAPPLPARLDLPRPTVRPGQPAVTPQALAPASDELVFCVFGDCRPAGNPERLGITRRLAGLMAAERPRLVLGAGDYVDGARTTVEARRQFDRFFESLSPLQQYGPVPLAAAVGNHDLAAGSQYFENRFGPRYYSFDLGNCHFIILDTEQSAYRGRIDGPQWEWLVADLQASAEARHVFVVLHQPLFPVAIYRGLALDRYPRHRDRLHLLFAQAKVSAVFSGHEHLYHRQERDGVPYFITGGGGSPLYASPARGGFHHYLRVSVKGDDYVISVKRL